MILADTSVWIDHFRRGNAALGASLEADEIVTHPFIRGELALGVFKQRSQVFTHFDRLPHVPLAGHAEVLAFIERHGLHGAGIGWVDAHILAAALLAGVRVWTLDTALDRAASTLGVKREDTRPQPQRRTQ